MRLNIHTYILLRKKDVKDYRNVEKKESKGIKNRREGKRGIEETKGKRLYSDGKERGGDREENM